ncbi:MAG: DUF885 family protein [Planctomycetes bacterium]|nr:DUF885 family protein [Planctomycetota bacterium]
MRGYTARRWLPSAQAGVPDYMALVQKQKELLPTFRCRLEAMDPLGWTVHARIDYLLLRSEMDKLEWELYVVRQTTRNPGFYVDQAIDNVSRLLTGGRVLGERPVLMPYTRDRARAILKALDETETILEQGRRNLTEMVPELAEATLRFPGGAWPTADWDAGHLNQIVENYRRWAEITVKHFPPEEGEQLVPAAVRAAERLLAFGGWLEKNRNRMTGSYIIGKDVLDWYIRHTFLMPYTSDQLIALAEIERARALSWLQFEEQKNRPLPKIGPAKTAQEYLAFDEETVLRLRRWYLEDGEDILIDQDYQPLIRSETCVYMPPFGMLAFPSQDKPGVSRVQVVPADHWMATESNYGWYTDPGVLQGHEYWPGHIYERKLHAQNPCPIRRVHADSGHSEGWCFYNEELLVALDFPFVRGPRSRELVYLNMLQRATRVLVGVPLLRGQITPEEALNRFQDMLPPLASGMGIPREESYMEVYKRILWRGNDCFDALAGKLQLCGLLADCKMRWKEEFSLREFHSLLFECGGIPFSLLRWELLGLDEEVAAFENPIRLSSVQSRMGKTE